MRPKAKRTGARLLIEEGLKEFAILIPGFELTVKRMIKEVKRILLLLADVRTME